MKKVFAGIGCLLLSMATTFLAAWLTHGPDHWYDVPVSVWCFIFTAFLAFGAVSMITKGMGRLK